MVRSFMAALAIGGASANTQIAFVGSGGCDPDEVTCVGGGSSENMIQAVEISRDGQMKPKPDLAIAAGGQPSWFAYYSQDADTSEQCMFVVRTDMDDIASYRLDPSGQVSAVGIYDSGGQTPVHANVLHGKGNDASVLLVANYHAPNNATTSDGATASSMIIRPDCSLELADVKQHSGSSVNPDRQGGAHVHSFTVAPYSQYAREAYVCDLGQDKIFSYAVEGNGKLLLSSTIGVDPGSGPRHLAQMPGSRITDGRHQYVYTVQEMSETVNVYVQTDCGGAACLMERQSVSLVAEGQSGEGSKACEIVMAPDGNTLYATNRGVLNTVTVFGIEHDGILTQKQQIEAPAYPRGMTLAFDGGLLLIAGQSKTELASYQVRADGTLERAYTITEGLPPHPAAFMMFDINSEEEVKEIIV